MNTGSIYLEDAAVKALNHLTSQWSELLTI
jgi:hypothetical protein